MLKTATTDATTVRLVAGWEAETWKAESYKQQEPENPHTRVYKELGPELCAINVYF